MQGKCISSAFASRTSRFIHAYMRYMHVPMCNLQDVTAPLQVLHCGRDIPLCSRCVDSVHCI